MGDQNLFGDLVKRPKFRSDILYFVQLAGNYAANIFVDMRNRASSKQKKAFYDWLSGVKNDDIDVRLKEALNNSNQYFDPFKKGYAQILEEMPLPLRDRMERAIQHDHVLPISLKNFIKNLDDLREYRHWLEHYDDRIKKGSPKKISDERAVQIITLMILPFLSAHMKGRIIHHARNMGMRHREIEQFIAPIDKIIRDNIASRRDASKYINGLKKRKSNEEIKEFITEKYGNAPSDMAVHRFAKQEKKKRNDLETRKQALTNLYNRYFDKDHWPRYNHENFLIRYQFLGKSRIKEVEEYIIEQNPDKKHIDFILDIEPIFMLSFEISLIIHIWFSDLEVKGVPIRDRKKLNKLNDKAARMVDIRNQIAHGGWIWRIENNAKNGEFYSITEIMEGLFAVLDHPNINDKAQYKNDLITALQGAFLRCKKSYIYENIKDGDPNQNRARYVINYWSTKNRDKFADRHGVDAKWRVERRIPLRKMAATWMRDLKKL
ncbi:hypothetical protein LPB140_08045 [Sphingorhabdus lutea]|uniref:Uncharacterized protein n=1 Tax=Sphingorhabdus lutea TaxID=1913578 RepID=A0A1L3JC97_9SPHN|nr:hypothetical protein [Sphingorhabdus lutea]APG62748.1 hypothetical protein LPB140_08045 [Sphingorhabdus lutea]